MNRWRSIYYELAQRGRHILDARDRAIDAMITPAIGTFLDGTLDLGND